MSRLTLVFVLLIVTDAAGEIRQVGAGKPYSMPCAAIADAQPGDRIEIDAAGVYRADVCAWKTDDLTIVGVNGRPKIDAGGRNSQGKAIWVISGNNTVVENIEFTGATVPNHNGAGIRQEGTNLTVRRCYFHNNEEGILTGANPSSKILIENTEFSENGYSDGQSHNIYIGNIGEFTLRYSYSHDSVVGHLVLLFRNTVTYLPSRFGGVIC